MVQDKGKYSIESYVLARHIMYQDVYYHHTTRGVEVLIRNALTRARELPDAITKLPSELAFMGKSGASTSIGHNDILLLDDHLFFRIFYQWSKCDDAVLSNLCKRFLERNLLKSIELSRDREQEYYSGVEAKVNELALSSGIHEPTYFCSLDFASETPYRPYLLGNQKTGNRSQQASLCGTNGTFHKR